MTSIVHLQDSFVKYLRFMRKTARLAFLNLDPEKREEAVCNVIALAWKSWARLGERGLDHPALLKSVLWYSIRQGRSGRTVCSAAKPRDPLVLRAFGTVQFEPGGLDDFVGKDTPVPDAVSFRVDVPMFMGTLSARGRKMAYDLASGMSTTEAAKKYGLSPGRISQFRREFKTAFEAFFAEVE